MDTTTLLGIAALAVPAFAWAWKTSVDMAVVKNDLKAIKRHLGLDS